MLVSALVFGCHLGLWTIVLSVSATIRRICLHALVHDSVVFAVWQQQQLQPPVLASPWAHGAHI
jgi:hypothetical protein